MQETDIQKFWEWFAANKHQLQSDSFDAAILKTLDNKISAWELNWEIGPGISSNDSLTISPKGDPELLKLTQHIIAKAPEVDGWEFYPAKQPKQNWFLLQLPDLQIDINACDWNYVLLQYDDGKTEILLKADTLLEFDLETKELIADIVLTNLLGEKLFMEKINYFDIVEDFEDASKFNELADLPFHLQEIK